MRLAIVIPCYNEAERLDFQAFESFMTRHPEVCFCFVNDGSSDGTGEVLEKLLRNTGSAVLTLERNSGKGEAVRQGLLYALKRFPESEVLGFWDADLATPLEALFDFTEWWQSDSLMLLGCRHARLGVDIRRKAYRHYLGRIFATAVSLHLDLPVYDTQCGAKLLKRELVSELLERPFVTKWFFDVELLRRCIKKYGRNEVEKHVTEVPLKKWVDTGSSKVNLFRCMLDFIKLLSTEN